MAWKQELYNVVENNGLPRACDYLIALSHLNVKPDSFISDLRKLFSWLPNQENQIQHYQNRHVGLCSTNDDDNDAHLVISVQMSRCCSLKVTQF